MASSPLLLAVDLDASFAPRLIEYAQGFATTMGMELQVLYVIEQGSRLTWRGFQTDEPLTEQALADAHAHWIKQLKDNLSAPLLADALWVRNGPMDERINAEIEALQTDLLMIGAESRTTVKRLMGGVNTSKITRSANCDVLVVGRRHLGLA